LLYQGIKGKAVRPLKKALTPLEAAPCYQLISKGYLPGTQQVGEEDYLKIYGGVTFG
jgi:hypothetical protein